MCHTGSELAHTWQTAAQCTLDGSQDNSWDKPIRRLLREEKNHLRDGFHVHSTASQPRQCSIMHSMHHAQPDIQSSPCRLGLSQLTVEGHQQLHLFHGTRRRSSR